ncbi:hypothetical protein AAVH_42513, partial [Aphelenchoides avenae]
MDGIFDHDSFIQEDSDDADLDKYDLTADPELAEVKLKLDLKKLRTNGSDEERPESAMSSGCSCSCSGGECSCVESDEDLPAKRPRDEKDERR